MSSYHLGLVDVIHAHAPVRAAEQREVGVELVDGGEGGDCLAVRHGHGAHQLVLARLPRLLVRQPHAVDVELVGRGGQQEAVQVEQLRAGDRGRVQRGLLAARLAAPEAGLGVRRAAPAADGEADPA